MFHHVLLDVLYVFEKEKTLTIDSLFDEVARIRDLYTKAGPADDLSDRWIKSAVLRNLLKDLQKKTYI